MAYKKTLAEELNKLHFLSGLKESYIMEDEVEDVEFEDKTDDLNKNLETGISKNFGSSLYLDTKEQDLLGFPEKVSMLVGSADGYKTILEKIFYSLYITKSLENKLYSVQNTIDTDRSQQIHEKIVNDIKNELGAEMFNAIKGADSLLISAGQNIKRKQNNLRNDVIKKINTEKELTQFNDIQDKIEFIKRLGAEQEIIDFLKSEQQGLKRDNYPTSTGDEKAIISYDFKAKDNDLKLTPRGFWQIQFLSRVAASQPKDEMEEILFGNGKYIGHALKVLRGFYTSAFHKTIAILTGRKYKINPNDHEFKIIKDISWDKVQDGLTQGKFDSLRSNFGAWAFTVAKNTTIDEIKKITEFEFVPTSDVAEAMDSNDIRTLSFTRPIKDIPENNLESSIADKGVYNYTFNSPMDIIDYLNLISTEKNRKGKLPQNWLLSLTSQSKTLLKNLGAIKSVKKFADFHQNDQGEEEFDKYSQQASGEDRNKIFSDLSKLYLDSTKMSINNKNLNETKFFESVTNENEERMYSDDQISDAFMRDLGKMLYFYQAEFTKQMPVWSRRPPIALVNAFIVYANENGIPVNEAQKISNVNSGDLVTNPIFYQDKDTNKEMLKFGEYDLGDYVFYKEQPAIGKHFDVSGQLKDEFYFQQEDAKKQNDLTYIFRGEEDIWKQIQNGVSAMNLSKKKSDKRRADFDYTKKEENEIVSAFLGALINNPKINDSEIRNYIFSFLNSKFKKLNLPADINNEELIKIYQSKKEYFIIDSGYKKLLISKYGLDERAKKYLYNQYTRTEELKQLSNKLSKLSGFEIQTENKKPRINEIQDYLKEINKTVFKTML